jgi:dihydroflavonol-4-reductase
MKVLITGGTGFIGSHLLERLAAEGHEIFALVRNPDRLVIPPASTVHPLQGDLFHLPDLPPALDVVFHLAASTKTLKRENYYTVNKDGTANFFAALRRLPSPPKTVLLSSLAAGGPSWETRSRRESDPPDPVTPYGESKLMSEQEALVFKAEIPLVILRAGAVYGPRDKDFLRFFKLVQIGLMPVVGRRNMPMTLCFIGDMVRALLIAAECRVPSGEVFNIGDAAAVTWERLGETAGRIFRKKALRIHIPALFAFPGAFLSEAAGFLAGRPTVITRAKVKLCCQPGWVADVSKAREMLGFETQTVLENGVRETIRWYRDRGWL